MTAGVTEVLCADPGAAPCAFEAIRNSGSTATLLFLFFPQPCGCNCQYILIKANSLAHSHAQPQSQGLCSVTTATKTQELIIVIDSWMQTHLGHFQINKHTEQVSLGPSPHRFSASRHQTELKLTQLFNLMKRYVNV